MGLIYSCCKYCCTCQCFRKKREMRRKSFVESRRSLSVNGEIVSEEIISYSLEEVEAHCKDMKNIYTYSIEAMQNFIGKTSYPYITQPKQLYPYILFLCEGLEAHEYVAIKDRIADKQLNIQLTVVVKEAKLIHPKFSEFSRIFCKLWLSSGKEYCTSIKDSSTVLLWDETFVWDVTDYDCDVFHIEVWSSRPGLLDKLSINWESLKEDDPLADEEGMHFLGDAVEYIKSLPCVGQNILWTLKKGPRRIQIKGQVNLYMQLGTKKESDFMLHFYCHMALLRLAFERQALQMDEQSDLWKNWLEILPNSALTLIQQHALQHGITPIEQCFCSWIVTSSLKMRHEDRISFYLILELLKQVLDNFNCDTISQMKDALCKSISDFSVYTQDVLNDLHKNFDVQNIQMADELYYMLKCMSTTEMKLCTSYVEAYQVIEDEASVWYLKIIADLKKDLEEDDSVEKMGEGLKIIMKTYLKNQIILDDIFHRAWNISYSSIVYRKLDEVVCTTIQPMIKHIMVILEDSKRLRTTVESLKMLQLYHNVRNVVNYILSCIPAEKFVLRMDEYSAWFGEKIILEWFLLCDIYTHPFIQRAVLADNMERLDQTIVHGTSIPDTISIIDEMVIGVWMKLKWKDQFYTHGALIEAMKSCVFDYYKGILERIEQEGFYCPAGEFEITTKLCVAMSNIYALSDHINETKKKIRRELKNAELALGFKIPDPLTAVQCEMQIMITHIFLLVFQKVEKRIKKLLKQSVGGGKYFLGLNCGKKDFDSGDLLLYLDNSLETLYSNLKTDAFQIILRHMWIVTLKTLKHGLSYSKGFFMTEKKRSHLFMVILQSLHQIKSIFYCDSHGLSEYEMENKIFEDLKCDLETKLK